MTNNILVVFKEQGMLDLKMRVIILSGSKNFPKENKVSKMEKKRFLKCAEMYWHQR